ncbi:MAG: BON domain-containing protein [Pirellulales bacterium]
MPNTECTLATRISSAIANSPHLMRRKVHFETEQGRVVLKGTVKTYYQKQMATEAVRRLDGVDHIENNLEVVWS